MAPTPTPTTTTFPDTDTADGDGADSGIDGIAPSKKPNGSYEKNGGGPKHSTASDKAEGRDICSGGLTLTVNSASESGHNNVIEDASAFQPPMEDHDFEEEGENEPDGSGDGADPLQEEPPTAAENERNGAKAVSVNGANDEPFERFNVASESDKCDVEMSQDGEQESEASKSAGPAKDRDEPTENKQPPLPSLPSVSFDQLINYPKRSLRAEYFFDLGKMKEIKPLMLYSMGMGVAGFPDFEEDPLIRMVTTRNKAQLYTFAEVFVSHMGKGFLKKEIMRRAVLYAMEKYPDNTTIGSLANTKISLPRPKSWTITQCIDWLMANSPPKDEHVVILKFDQQWRQQIRDHLGRASSKSANRALAIAEFDRAKKDREPRGEEQEGGSEIEVVGNDRESSLDDDNQSLTGYRSAESERSNQPENTELIPPGWPDVTHSQLRNYPKISLRAQSYFDILQLRAIKPITLVAMGIGVPGFPDLENDRMIKRATARNKSQLYYTTDVFASIPGALPFLRKEIMRRSILYRLRRMGDEVNYNNVDHASKTRIPRISSYSSSKCRDWMETNPPPEDEHNFILRSVMQWRKQVREQLGWVEHKSKELEEALAEFDEEENKKAEEEKELKTEVANAAETAGPGQLKDGLDSFTDQLEVSHAINQSAGSTYKRQLAAAVGLNKAQAQTISHFQQQLIELRTHIAAAAERTEFEIFVSKDTFKFNASHFVAYPGFRERLHGHSYRASIRLLGSHKVRRDGYVLDFGRVKAVAEDVCKGLNEYILIPSQSEVLDISVEDDDDDGNIIDPNTPPGPKKSRKRKRSRFPGCIFIKCDDGSMFLFPRQDCVLLPIMHTTSEELAVFLYGKILNGLSAKYLHNRGVKSMEVTVSEAVGQDAVFRKSIPTVSADKFDVASFVTTMNSIPVMPCRMNAEKPKRPKYSKKVHEQGNEA